MCTLCRTCKVLILTDPQLSSTMSPVNQTLKYDYQHETKGGDKIWDFRDNVCRIEGQKAIESVHFAEHVKCSYSRTHNSPQPCRQSCNQTLNYNYQHETKGGSKVWDFRDNVCRIESQKPMKCVHFAEYEKYSCILYLNTVLCCMQKKVQYNILLHIYKIGYAHADGQQQQISFKTATDNGQAQQLLHTSQEACSSCSFGNAAQSQNQPYEATQTKFTVQRHHFFHSPQHVFRAVFM